MSARRHVGECKGNWDSKKMHLRGWLSGDSSCQNYLQSFLCTWKQLFGCFSNASNRPLEHPVSQGKKYPPAPVMGPVRPQILGHWGSLEALVEGQETAALILVRFQTMLFLVDSTSFHPPQSHLSHLEHLEFETVPMNLWNTSISAMSSFILSTNIW